MKINYFTLFLVMAVCACSCQNGSDNGSQKSNDSLVVKVLDSVAVEKINEQLTSVAVDTSGPKVDTVAVGPGIPEKFHSARGKTYKLWRKLHKDCQSNDVSRDMVYFGVSNTLGVGTIVTITEDGRLIPDFPLLREKFDTSQARLIYNEGAEATCTFDQSTKVDVEFNAQSQFNTNGFADLNAALGSARNITAKMDSWQINNLLVGGLAEVLKDTSNAYFKSYRNRLNGPKRYIVITEIVVNGFSENISTRTQISAGLKAQLDAGMIQNVGQTAAKVKFSYVNETTIKMTTVGKFNVFCTLAEAAFVN